MQDKILETFTNYAKDNNLNTQNCNDFLKSETYISFFNDITVSILGEPLFTHDKTPATKGALVYMPHATKERFVDSIDILSINALYYGILGRLEYNYQNYTEFIKILKETRTNIKKEMMDNGVDETLNITQQLMKIYMNLIYGMIDNAQSVLTSSHSAPREFIVEESKKAILMVASFLVNKSLPIFYIDTDEIHTERLSDEILKELVEFYESECSKVIDTKISTLDRDNMRNISSYYVYKKRYITGDMKSRGMKHVDRNEVLSENKKFFGENFPDIFPEYSL